MQLLLQLLERVGTALHQEALLLADLTGGFAREEVAEHLVVGSKADNELGCTMVT